MITLRNTQDDDIEFLWKIYLDAYSKVQFSPDFLSKQRFKDMIARESIALDRSLIALDDESEGMVVGFLLLSLKEPIARISGLGVIESYRKQGIAKRLLNRLIRDIREVEGITTMVVETMEDEPHLAKLFSDYGFNKERTLHSFYRENRGKESTPSRFVISTEFPTELIKHHGVFHNVEQPWMRKDYTISQYKNGVVGYALNFKGKLVSYALVGFDCSLLDFAVSPIAKDKSEFGFSMMYSLIQKFHSLVAIDVPQDDELFEIYEKTGFQVAYKRSEMILRFRDYD